MTTAEELISVKGELAFVKGVMAGMKTVLLDSAQEVSNLQKRVAILEGLVPTWGYGRARRPS